MSRKSVVLIGIGEMGGVFARGLLRIGCPIAPVTRNMAIDDVANAIPAPALVLITVAESDLHPVLNDVPAAWRDRIGLLQNELLPRDWEPHNLVEPTVIVVWFEKKKGQDYKIIIPSPVYGPNTRLIGDALQTLDIPCRALTSKDDLLFELVRKNIYILTTNIAGLVTGGTVRDLWQNHEKLARQVANEIIDIQGWLTGTELPRDRLIAGMVHTFNADPEHRCTGRSAPARLARALQYADEAGLAVAKLREIKTGR